MDSPKDFESRAYDQAVEFLYSRINYEKTGHASYSSDNYRLDRMRRLLELVGNPQSAYPIVHIAGTKGKGTTATVTAALLTACGLRVGTYTSPHLRRIEERIRFQGVPCTNTEFANLAQRMRSAAEQIEAEGGGKPTFFELTTAMGMLHFADKQCDIVVLEVGLGGRLDSTNVCQPTVCVITSISFDHQAQLGNTIEAIAGEKAGIIKPRVPVVCSARDPIAQQVVSDRCDLQQSLMYMVDRDFAIQWRPLPIERRDSQTGPDTPASGHAQIDYRPAIGTSRLANAKWQIQLLGRHQADNIAAAMTVIDLLADCPQLPYHPHLGKVQTNIRSVGIDRLQSCLRDVRVPARLQVVGTNPNRIIDTAHNPASIAATLDALEDHFPGWPRTILFASSRDKDFRAMLRLLITKTERLILTAYTTNPRGLPLEELTAAFRDERQKIDGTEAAKCECLMENDCRVAWHKATAYSEDVICATGSFFLAAELLEGIGYPEDA